MGLTSDTKEWEVEKGCLRLLLESIVNCYPEAAGAEYSEITLYDGKSNEFIGAAATGKDRDDVFSGKRLGYARDEGRKTLTQKAMESRNPVIIHDVNEAALADADRAMVDRLGIRSTAVFPLFAGSRFVGSISFDHGGHTHRFTQQDINAMYALADLAAHLIGYAENFVGPKEK